MDRRLAGTGIWSGELRYGDPAAAAEAAGELEEGRTRTVLQGREAGRESEIWLSRAPGEIRVAGRVRFVARGRMLPEFLA